MHIHGKVHRILVFGGVGAFGVIVMLLVGLIVGGCTVVGPFYGVFIDPLIPGAKVPAEHSLLGKSVLIWIDDGTRHGQSHLLRRQLAYYLRKELVEHRAVGDIVAEAEVIRFRQAQPDFAELTIQQLGKHFTVDEVLYIFIEKLQLRYEATREFYRPEVIGCSRIIEVDSGNRVWPGDQSCRAFSVRGNLVEGRGRVFEEQLIGAIAQEASSKLAPFFYTHREEK